MRQLILRMLDQATLGHSPSLMDAFTKDLGSPVGSHGKKWSQEFTVEIGKDRTQQRPLLKQPGMPELPRLHVKRKLQEVGMWKGIYLLQTHADHARDPKTAPL